MFLVKSPNNDLGTLDNYTKYTPECYEVYLGSSGESTTFDFSRYKKDHSYGSATIFISTASDVDVDALVSGAILTCGHHGGLRFVAYNADTSITYSIYGYNLTIKTGNYPYGVHACIKVFNENTNYRSWTPYPF